MVKFSERLVQVASAFAAQPETTNEYARDYAARARMLIANESPRRACDLALMSLLQSIGEGSALYQKMRDERNGRPDLLGYRR